MLKKVSVALLGLGFSAVALAGAPKDQVVMPTGINLLAPDSVGSWMVGLEALYVRAPDTSLQYAAVTDGSVPVTTIKNQTVNSDNHWGGTADFSYMFPGQSRDLKFVYTHLETPDTSAVGDLLGLLDSTRGHVRHTYNAVDGVLGQWVRIGDRVDLHPFGGLRYANINTHDTVNEGASGFLPLLTGLTAKINSQFQGLGPRAGMDVDVNVGSGVSIVSTVGASLLIGDMHESRTIIAPIFNFHTSADEEEHVVPEVDARIGLHYSYSFDTTTVAGLELGYQAVNYFNAIDIDNIDITAPNTVNNSENYGYYGPYLRLQLAMS